MIENQVPVLHGDISRWFQCGQEPSFRTLSQGQAKGSKQVYQVTRAGWHTPLSDTGRNAAMGTGGF
jgi:hypothetical protein